MACSALRDISRSNQRHHSYCYLPVKVPDVANGRPSASINGGIEEAAWWIDSATQCPRRPKPETHWPQSAAQQHVAARRALAPDISPRRPRASYEHRARASPRSSLPSHQNKASAGRRHRRHSRTPQHGQPILGGAAKRAAGPRRLPSASPAVRGAAHSWYRPCPLQRSAIHRDHGAIR